MDTLLFYTPGTCALACMIALETLGEPYSVCLVTKEERSTDRFKQVNPRGQVPAMRLTSGPESRMLMEVNAIIEHIADRKPEAELLPPHGTWERDVANQWLSSLGTGLHPAFWPWYGPQKYTTDPAAYEGVKAASILAIQRELGFIDRHLEKNEHVLGAKLSALDGYLYSMARWAVDMMDLPKQFPNVFRHQKMMTALPVVRRCTAVERARDLPTPSTALLSRLTLATLPA
jgi:glutathione S-transferase